MCMLRSDTQSLGSMQLCENNISNSLKVHSQGLLWQQIDLDIWNLYVFLSQVTKFHNSRARRSWKRAIIYGT